MNPFPNVRTWLMFVGYGRSGHSFIGSALDAHPSVCITHEADAVRRSEHEFKNRDELFRALRLHNQEIYESGRLTNNRWGEPYRQSMEGQLKLDVDLESVQVLGNKNGSIETGSDEMQFDLRLKRFQQFLGPQIEIKMLSVLRNPFDAGLMDANVFRLLETISKRYEDRICVVRHEDFIENPQNELQRICTFLSLPMTDDYAQIVASKTFRDVHKSRFRIDFSDEQKSNIQTCIDQSSLFSGYSYES